MRRPRLPRSGVYLLAAAQLFVSGAMPAHAAQALDVVDAATLDVQMDSAATQRVRLLGVGPDTSSSVCGAQQARARAAELLAGQGFTVEAQSPDADSRPAEPLAAYIWLADGQNLAELLVREGDLPAAAAQPHPRVQAFATAQAAAINDRVGIWAPGACEPQPDQRAELAAVVGPSAFALQRARTAVNVLRDQARSAPQVIGTPTWLGSTDLALGWLNQAASTLQATAAPQTPAAGLVAGDLIQLGGELQAQSAAYAAGVAAGDPAQLATAATSLAEIGDRLPLAAAKVSALATLYNIGD